MRNNTDGPRELAAVIGGIVMTAIVLAAIGLGAAADKALAAESTARDVKQPAVTDSGKPSAAQLLAAALDAETQNDATQRSQLLRQALSLQSDLAAAHWQLGQMNVKGRWLDVDAAANAAQDATLGSYRELRADFGDDPEAHLVLARWCQKHQLPAEAQAHAMRLLELRPGNPDTIKLLGLTWHEGVLVSPQQLAREKARAEQAKVAFKYWRPKLEELRRKIENSATAEHKEGLNGLRAIRDPSAIEALDGVFKRRRDMAGELVEVIGKIPGPEATDWLLRQAVLAKRDEVRLAACRQLRERPLHAFVPRLMGSLSTPLEASIEVVRTGDDIRFRSTVQRTSATAVYRKTVETDVTTMVPNPNLGGIIGAVYTETFLNEKKTEKQIEAANRKLTEFNAALYAVLERTTDQKQLPHQPEPWWNWWQDYNQLSSTMQQTVESTYVQNVDVPYVPYVPHEMLAPPSTHHSCFADGTKVWTLTGPLPIERIRVGDRVLAQDPISGELDYKVVLQTTLGHQAMIAIGVGDEPITATKGHVFWVSGIGWRMAKDLQVGQRLHTLAGWTEIRSLEPVAEADTHNLVVADFGTFFVGDERLLVHDITMMQPTTALVPGQAER